MYESPYYEAGDIDRITESRILSDAELIKDGARIILGRLVITENQYEKARLAGNADFNVAKDLYLLPVERYDNLNDSTWDHPELDQTLETSWQQAALPDDVRTWNTLKRYGIFTIRDLLVLGREKIAEIRGVGEGSLAAIKTVLESQSQEWKDRPSAADIAEYCEDLLQVDARAAIPRGRYLHLLRKVSVHDLLVAPIGNQGNVPADLLDIEPEVYHSAEVFALQFYEAKHLLPTPLDDFDKYDND